MTEYLKNIFINITILPILGLWFKLYILLSATDNVIDIRGASRIYRSYTLFAIGVGMTSRL